MNAATSAIVREEHQTAVCIYCGEGIKKRWKYIISNGLEYHISICDNGHEARIKEGNALGIEELVRICGQDRGDIRKR